MKLFITPAEIPFMIGDLVWVNQTCGETNQYPYFQAEIIQIILDGSLTNSIVIRHREAAHELLVTNGIYDLKPVGDCAQLGRVVVTVNFLSTQNVLFGTELDLLTLREELLPAADL